MTQQESQTEAAALPALEAASPGSPPMAEAHGNAASMTPFMRQWSAAKRENPDALLFFRMGDFYELFYDDAAVASRELQLTLTARDKERQVPMCGVPYHAVESYLARLLRKGYRIAICDQMEDPRLTKKIVRREVTRVLSPGTALDAGLGQERNNFLAAYFEMQDRNARHGGPACGLALLDVSTGEFRTAEFSGPAARQQAVDELLLAAPSEVLLTSSAEPPAQLERVAARTRVEDWAWTRDFAVPLVERQLNARSLEGYGLAGHEAAAIAAGVVLHYVRTTQK
ncbi:MAG TPA: DNA mismatch repair protein MutS, partial [Terracidiphilus sp.]|nr:DNA mismatch repair protein MutS [Terracidiphilus sp.]